MSKPAPKAILLARHSPRPVKRKRRAGPGLGIKPQVVEEKTLSCTVQLERLRAYCTLTGWEIATKADGSPAEFMDEDKSASTTEGRTEMEEAIKLACRLKGILVAVDVDRLARN